MTIASSRIPKDSPVAITRTGRSGFVLNERNEMARMSAAEVTSLPVRESALTIASGVDPVLSYLLAHAREHEHLIVHREAEEKREDDDGDEVADRSGSWDAIDQVRSVSLLPEQHQEAV
jgi:hypothetical protein